MSMFENNIVGLIPQRDWLDVGFNVTRPNDPIDGLFGDTRTDNIVASWQSLAAEYQIPMMAQFHGFDTEAATTFRAPVDTHNIEKGLVKVKINQSERMQALLRSGVREDALYDYVVQDGVRLANQVVTRSKVAKNELMATGKVTIKENNLDLTVDYGVPADQTAYELDFGTSAATDIVTQIRDIIDKALEKGVTITGLLTSSKNLLRMRSNAAVQKAINGNVGVGALVSNTAFRAWMNDEFGISDIITNDLTYGAEGKIGADGRPTVTTKRYFPADKVTFFSGNPSGKLGDTLWGDPPEVNLPGFFPTNASGESPYVYVTQKMDWDPAVLWTKASALMIPVLYNPNSLFIASVTNTAATAAVATQSTKTSGKATT